MSDNYYNDNGLHGLIKLINDGKYDHVELHELTRCICFCKTDLKVRHFFFINMRPEKQDRIT